jgi:pyruvate formate lyase activating enzyme
VSGGDSSQAEALMAVLRFLKKEGLKLELDTDGRNAALLERVVEAGLADRIVMDVKGPLSLYARILGVPIDAAEIRKTIGIVSRMPDHRFETTIAPVDPGPDGVAGVRYLTPDEIGKTAELIKTATGDNRQPYRLRLFNPENGSNEDYSGPEGLAPNNLLPYRMAARKHLVHTEIKKS